MESPLSFADGGQASDRPVIVIGYRNRLFSPPFVLRQQGLVPSADQFPRIERDATKKPGAPKESSFGSPAVRLPGPAAFRPLVRGVGFSGISPLVKHHFVPSSNREIPMLPVLTKLQQVRISLPYLRRQPPASAVCNIHQLCGFSAQGRRNRPFCRSPCISSGIFPFCRGYPYSVRRPLTFRGRLIKMVMRKIYGYLTFGFSASRGMLFSASSNEPIGPAGFTACPVRGTTRAAAASRKSLKKGSDRHGYLQGARRD